MPRKRTYSRTTRARSTGTLVTVCESDPGEIEEGLPWMTICEEHGGCVCHETLAVARSWASAPEGWCEDCTPLTTATQPKNAEDQ